jgi:hypothetical protein
MSFLLKLEQEQTRGKEIKRKKIIKTRAEINKIENRKVKIF